jgi:hypothetical protein
MSSSDLIGQGIGTTSPSSCSRDEISDGGLVATTTLFLHCPVQADQAVAGGESLNYHSSILV